jgi:hypothetical protein
MDQTPAIQMPVLQQIFSFFRPWFGRYRAQGKAITFDLDSPIKKLPAELILLIVDYLPVASGASLSLTCHSFHLCLRERCLESLKKAGYSTMDEFLHFLERDLPTHIVCPHCVQLHSMSFAKNYHLLSQTESRSSRPWLACWHADLKSELQRGTYAEFSSTIFRMAMKAYRQSHETTQLLSLLSCGTKRLFGPGFVEQRTAAARIQEGSLLLREQRVVMVPSSQEIPLSWYSRGGIIICPHIWFPIMTSLHQYGIQIPRATEIEGYENRQGLIYCDHCYTEFRVDFKSYGKAGNAMFVTKWMDLGEGRDLRDHKFRSRFSSVEETSWTKVAFRRGSVCASFEQKLESTFEFDSLLSQQDEENLCTQSPWPLPEGIKVSLIGIEPLYVVKHGRFFFSRQCTIS